MSPFLNLSCEDCMALMVRYPDKHFDLAIVDPPYGVEINMNLGRKKNAAKPARERKKWDGSIPSAQYFAELRRVSHHQIILGGNYFPPTCSRGWIYWDKDIAEGVSFGDGELAWTSMETVGRRVRIQWSGFLGADGERIHPTQKPVALYHWLLDRYAAPGQRILDTHLGSGSHAIAAYYFGAHLTACEIDADYFAAAQERIARETAQIAFL